MVCLSYTIIFISHDFSVVEKLCDRIAFIKEGKILEIGTQDEIKNLLESEKTAEVDFINKKQEIISGLQNHNFIIKRSEQQNIVIVQQKEKSYYKVLLNLLQDFKI